MNQRIKSISSNYSFKGKIWKHIGSAAWHFVSLPKALSKKIRTKLLSSEEGWGRLKAEIKIKNTKWKSAIW
ncbi:MAG: DUF1905 domain-containing protein [Oligoflexia bacterium]|nr:DUF1905 domain-containing protein [Oligoflexia bacterium]